MQNATPISDYRGTKRYIKYTGSQHLKGIYLTAFYDVFHFEVEDGMETPSLDFRNKRVELKATNDVAVDSQGNFFAKNSEGFWVDTLEDVIINSEGEPAQIGEAGLIGQLDFLENVNVSLNTLTSLEIQRADALKRFDKPVNGVDVVLL